MVLEQGMWQQQQVGNQNYYKLDFLIKFNILQLTH